MSCAALSVHDYCNQLRFDNCSLKSMFVCFLLSRMRSVDSIYFKGKCELYASRGNVGGSRRRGSGITPAGFKGRVGGCG